MKWIAMVACGAMVCAVAFVIGWRATSDHHDSRRACERTNSCLSLLPQNDK